MRTAALVAAVTLVIAPATTRAGPGAGAGGRVVQPAPVVEALPRVLVMPFDADGRLPTTYWLGEGAALALADALAARGMGAVTRDERVRAFEDLHLPLRGALSRPTIVRVGQLMGASAIVLGSVSLVEGTLTLRARLLSLDAGRYRPEVREEGPATTLFQMCQRLAVGLAPADGAGQAPAPSGPPARAVSLDAFEAFVKGLLAEGPPARIQALGVAIEKQPGYDRALLALWDAHTDAGDHAAALAAARAVPQDSARADRAGFLAALSLVELGRLDDAFTTLRALADARPTAAIFNNLGVVQLRRGVTPQTGRATYYFDQAAEHDVDDPDICFNLGYAYLLEREPVAAAYWLREAVRRNTADADAHFALGVALQASGAPAEGSRERELARRLSSTYDAWETRGGGETVPRGLERIKPALASWRTPQIDAALAAADLRAQRELATFYLERARRATDDQRDNDALADLRRALFLAPYHADALLLAGRVQLRAGRPEEAIATLRVALWHAESSAAHVALAEALLSTEDRAAAKAELARALELDPANPEAKALLDRLEPAVPR